MKVKGSACLLAAGTVLGFAINNGIEVAKVRAKSIGTTPCLFKSGHLILYILGLFFFNLL